MLRNRIGNASGEPEVTTTVTGVAGKYVGSYLYLGSSAWHSLGIKDQAADGTVCNASGRSGERHLEKSINQ